ncbi:hypothetical protein [Thalassoroseus pseudoceratinae]|uniref:hypothetical protein n=1 Tax=Thalassoroseus pseudoceratinae TaxID=2713176 RepID=UPI001421C489|nr:hypothetical protein [Thalassoroseus pseudoceratinae]
MTAILQDESDVIPISPTAASVLSDEDFLRHLVWAETADRQLTEAADQGDVAAVIARLRKRNFGLGANSNRKSVLKMRFDPTPAAWSMEIADETESTRDLFDIWTGKGFHSGKKKHRQQALRDLARWTENREQRIPLSTGEILVICELLRWEHAALSDDQIWKLWRMALTATLSRPPEKNDPIGSLVRTGELAWTAGLLFSDVFGLEALREQGRSTLWNRLEESTDGDGTPRAEILENLSGWLSVWTRAAEWAHAAKIPLWQDEDQSERFAGLVETSAAMLGPDGKLPGHDRRLNAVPMLATAAKLAGWKKKHSVFHLLLSHGLEFPIKSSSGSPPAKPEHESSLAYQSDFASVACLRTDWNREAGRIVLTYDDPIPSIDLSANGVSWFSGEWGWQLNGPTDQRKQSAEWTCSCSCWFDDDEVSFVELQWKVSEDIHIERQILLAREEKFAVLADCVSGLDDAPQRLRSRLPLSMGITSAQEKETRAWQLRSGKQSMRVFPLPLPDDVVEGTAGQLQVDAESLTFEMPVTRGAYLPMVFDWHPDRQQRRADWRQLTVTEEGQRVGPDAAGGYRLRVGSYQILLYRSLTEKRLRTVLGHHTGHETVIGQFDDHGDVQPLLLVE